MREKLEDIICESVQYDECVRNCNYPPCGMVRLTADRLLANGVTVRGDGEWIHDPLSSYGVHVWFCSQCNGEVIRQTEFCPHCGADMRGAEHG